MSASRQGMSYEEMEQVVAQRVANAIEVIAIYELKIHMAHDLMNQVVREEATRIEVVRAHATRAGNKKAYPGNLPYCNKCIGYIKKDKNEAKTDKTEHGIGRARGKQSQRHIHF
ncbi:hypothetical protein Tco_0626434 [Tanacetum coccineum]|uniref:Uncharacterized protein n=1 Tax=Tanacetum coccineum TaxID=301880 RepID=A0ABQ4WJJ0_9ASTR